MPDDIPKSNDEKRVLLRILGWTEAGRDAQGKWFWLSPDGTQKVPEEQAFLALK